MEFTAEDVATWLGNTGKYDQVIARVATIIRDTGSDKVPMNEYFPIAKAIVKELWGE